MLAAQNVQKHYIRRQLLGSKATIEAVNDVSLEIRPGETLGLVGESGCGKSTLGRCLASLEPINGGRIVYNGQDITHFPFRKVRELRKEIQLVFQDPIDSLNPRLTVEQILMEPLYHFGIGSLNERREKAQEQIVRVGLGPEHLHRHPGELSRGQCQRVNIARALILDPKILICDEIISALDVSVGVQILHLLRDLQQERGYGYLFISHDLSRVIQISHRIAVMYMGKIVEVAPGPLFHMEACHPYSRALLASVPTLKPGQQEYNEIFISEELPDPANPPNGCRFHPRCPYATDLCREKEPDPIRIEEDHEVACHHIG